MLSVVWEPKLYEQSPYPVALLSANAHFIRQKLANSYSFCAIWRSEFPRNILAARIHHHCVITPLNATTYIMGARCKEAGGGERGKDFKCLAPLTKYNR